MSAPGNTTQTTPAERAPLKTVGIKAATLMTANVAAMSLPLVSLSLIAHRLGMEALGTIVLAQSLGMIPVLLVDAGFNAESMRATAARDEHAPLQPLLDNLLARGRLAVIAAALALLASTAIPSLSLGHAALGLLQLLGTLLFPQWWLIATGASLSCLGMQLAGRIAAVAGIALLVQGPDDLALAVALQCGATLLSGLLFAAFRLAPRGGELARLSWTDHAALTRRVRPAVGSGFLVSIAANTPQLVIGAAFGPQQAALFAAPEKIARAGVFALGAIDQTFMAPVARARTRCEATSRRYASRVVLASLAIGLLLASTVAVASPFVLPLLFGPEFADGDPVMWLLCAWMPSYCARRSLLNLHYVAQERTDLISRCQYVEGLATLSACAAGAVACGAVGAAVGLLCAEAAAWAWIASDRIRGGHRSCR